MNNRHFDKTLRDAILGYVFTEYKEPVEKKKELGLRWEITEVLSNIFLVYFFNMIQSFNLPMFGLIYYIFIGIAGFNMFKLGKRLYKRLNSWLHYIVK